MKKFLLGSIAIAALMTAPALAADFPVKGPVYAPAWNWTGFYVGLQAGYGWSSSSVDVVSNGVGTSAEPTFTGFIPGPFTPTATLGLGALAATSGANAIPGSFKTDPRGVNAGLLIGYDWQFAPRWVAGIEADLSETDMRGRQTLNGGGGAIGAGTVTFLAAPFAFTVSPAATATASATTEQKLDWLGTVRGRIGFLVTPELLVFATGGLAYGHMTAETTVSEALCVSNGTIGFGTPNAPGCTSGAATGSLSQTRFGSAVGAGLQYAFARNWSIKTEYLHWDLGRSSFALTPMSLQTTTTIPLFPFTGTAPVGAAINSNASTRFNGDFLRLSVNYKLD